MGRLIRWEPMAGVSQLRDEMNRLLEDFFGETGEERTPANLMRIPSVDVVDRDNEVLVRVDLPGVKKDQVRIEASPDALLIRAEMEETREKKDEHFVRRERRSGVFQRVVPMPVEIKVADVRATFTDGVLEVTLPKSEQAKSRQPVQVKVE